MSSVKLPRRQFLSRILASTLVSELLGLGILIFSSAPSLTAADMAIVAQEVLVHESQLWQCQPPTRSVTRSLRPTIPIAEDHRLVHITDTLDWTEMEERAQQIRSAKLKNAAGRPPHLRALLGATVFMATRKLTYREAEDGVDRRSENTFRSLPTPPDKS